MKLSHLFRVSLFLQLDMLSSYFNAVAKPKPLQKVKFAEEELKSASSPELGYFKDPNAHHLVDKARDMK